jgi:hypothetical protein
MTKWLFIVVLTGILTGDAYAETKKEETEKGITPYGVLCPLHGEYGYCKKEGKHEEAVRVLEKYYKE